MRYRARWWTHVTCLLAVGLTVLASAFAPAHLGAAADVAPTSTTAAASTSIRGQIIDEKAKPIAGVRITVRKGADTIGDARTGADGKFVVALPGGGVYSVTLDTATLPEGVELSSKKAATLPRVEVLDGFSRSVRFPLGPATGGGPSTVDQLLDLAFNGLRLGLVLAVASIGLSLIFAVTGLTNFAHGEMVTFGALIAYFVTSSAAGPGWSLFVGAAVAVAAGGGFGLAQERVLFRPLRRRGLDPTALIVVTIGLGILLRNVYLIIFGGGPRPYNQFTLQKNLDLGPFAPRPKDLVIMLTCIVVLALYGFFVQRTRTGTAMRAVADSGELSAASGIAVDRVILTTWGLGGALAAFGGVLAGVSDTVQWDMGLTLLLLMFAAVVLGGLGTAYGPVVGGIVIGVVSEVSTYWISPKFRTGVALAVLIVMILLRPQGLLGRPERVG